MLDQHNSRKEVSDMMFEVFENEGWRGWMPQWYATDGKTPSVTFDNEQDAQEYCDKMNDDVCVCGDDI